MNERGELQDVRASAEHRISQSRSFEREACSERSSCPFRLYIVALISRMLKCGSWWKDGRVDGILDGQDHRYAAPLL